MTREMNKASIDLVKQWEGCKLTAYLDTGGVWTIGIGHTSVAGPPKVTKGLTITLKEAETIFQNDMLPVRKWVEKNVKVSLNDNQFGVLCSWAFNVGTGAAGTSTLLRKLNTGDYKSVPSELAKWKYDNGKVVQGLINRRAAEAKLWSAPIVFQKPVEEPKPVPSTTIPEAAKEPPTVIQKPSKGLLQIILDIIKALRGG